MSTPAGRHDRHRGTTTERRLGGRPSAARARLALLPHEGSAVGHFHSRRPVAQRDRSHPSRETHPCGRADHRAWAPGTLKMTPNHSHDSPKSQNSTGTRASSRVTTLAPNRRGGYLLESSASLTRETFWSACHLHQEEAVSATLPRDAGGVGVRGATSAARGGAVAAHGRTSRNRRPSSGWGIGIVRPPRTGGSRCSSPEFLYCDRG